MCTHQLTFVCLKLMEIERVKELKRQEQAEIDLRRRRAQGALEIKEQMSEREQQRMIEEELRDQETQAILQRMQDMKAEDALVCLFFFIVMLHMSHCLSLPFGSLHKRSESRHRRSSMRLPNSMMLCSPSRSSVAQQSLRRSREWPNTSRSLRALCVW